jgi:CheY-like chemotaxis protein
MTTQKTKHVLVIDHDPVNRNFITTLLAGRGYTADQAVNRDEAKELLSQNEYDLLIIDLQLPDENGTQLLSDLIRDYPAATEHTMVMTESRAGFVQGVPQDGWCAMLVKPFTVSEFYRIVDLCMVGLHLAEAY